jgi:hypothetical protein
MSEWTHRICSVCWNKREPNRRPAVVINQEFKPCCFCGTMTNAGIYVRHDPQDLLCKHEEEA